MAMCKGCTKVVAKNEVTRVVEVRVIDGEEHTFGYLQPLPVSAATGKLKALYHYKCFLLRKKAEVGRWNEGVPTAYEESAAYRNRDDVTAAALSKRQQEIAEQRALEETPRGEDDWREPIQVVF